MVARSSSLRRTNARARDQDHAPDLGVTDLGHVIGQETDQDQETGADQVCAGPDLGRTTGPGQDLKLRSENYKR